MCFYLKCFPSVVQLNKNGRRWWRTSWLCIFNNAKKGDFLDASLPRSGSQNISQTFAILRYLVKTLLLFDELKFFVSLYEYH